MGTTEPGKSCTTLSAKCAERGRPAPEPSELRSRCYPATHSPAVASYSDGLFEVVLVNLLYGLAFGKSAARARDLARGTASGVLASYITTCSSVASVNSLPFRMRRYPIV